MISQCALWQPSHFFPTEVKVDSPLPVSPLHLWDIWVFFIHPPVFLLCSMAYILMQRGVARLCVSSAMHNRGQWEKTATFRKMILFYFIHLIQGDLWSVQVWLRTLVLTINECIMIFFNTHRENCTLLLWCYRLVQTSWVSRRFASVGYLMMSVFVTLLCVQYVFLFSCVLRKKQVWQDWFSLNFLKVTSTQARCHVVVGWGGGAGRWTAEVFGLCNFKCI